ncbi:MAG: hypothetical protein NT154_33715 [Verrucomicrobia bacterium]|nr:hypothetical protein [Verrucomicrobiota bacterium]
MKLILRSLPLMVGVSALAQEVVVPSETAARETLRLSAEQSTLRLGGLDLFPHATGQVQYDDNILISHTDPLKDVIWTFSPGLTLAGGGVGAYLPGSVTVEQLRNLLYYSLVEDVKKPGRFFAVDYTPSFNFYTDHSGYDNTGQSAKLSGGYAFSRLALGLDFDYDRAQVKNTGVGTLTQDSIYNARFHSRYDLTDRTSLEVNGQYYRLDYDDPIYQGYDEFKNEDWLNRQFADRLSLGVGLGVGFVFPNESANQTYEQLLARAVYRLSGKLYFSSALGVELREYDSGQADTVNPVVSLTGIYQVREGTTLRLEGHRRDDPSIYAGQNTTALGASIGASQLLFGRLSALAFLGYDNYKYNTTVPGSSTSRSDNYFFGRLQFDYKFNRHVTGSLFYTYYRDDSSYGFYSYDDNVVGLQVMWRL